ncbi:UDP-N-acetylmuramoyl-L-alanine--D-glutamate ligase [Exilibacterium tricleocarpae]|uniref:UDP-N-acetylmuramoylalanine--D-glutamate ligase n=1 Tax=Exilibacterium tricleocarpae TaxID=2591008 RepID=A0A545TQA7_9GAMM|nr:UDP-N-acetylmuramoyl-L-alanine--D-glutamate ligase [Exilibacterium tricleocarpae]TQV79423.1 UDP-N-acetylmuramoyl-L-alanine--D-glutamate ligase [Exilibacterium tricleocarpae]
MAELIAQSGVTAIVGLGATGLSVARYLAGQGRPFVVLDSRPQPPNLARFRADFPGVHCELGRLDSDTLCAVEKIVLSPGVALAEEAVQAALQQGVEVLGDIELFVRAARAPIVAITGSNGKSTVTTLVGEMAQAAGLKVAVGGNLGPPALDLLDATVQLYVVELSSFQLETTASVNAVAATILNLSADHLDRYASMVEYHAAKQRIYFGAEHVVVNRDDLLTQAPRAGGVGFYSFGLSEPDLRDFGLRQVDGEPWLAQGLDALMPVQSLAMRGRHNIANALAAMALAHAIDLPRPAVLETLSRFKGLAHRCEWVAEKDGVEFFNDSKGTNVGATLAAITGLARAPGKVVLIAGGEAKDADFSPLAPVLETQVRSLVLIGRDAEKIAAVAGAAPRVYAQTLQQAVAAAAQAAQAGDAVLLSPACASFDMFADYRDRGDQFKNAVREWVA